jgi:hypothetical protein
MLRAVSQKNRPARVGHRIPSGKLGQSQIQITAITPAGKSSGQKRSMLRRCQKCVLGHAPYVGNPADEKPLVVSWLALGWNFDKKIGDGEFARNAISLA